MRALVTGGAGFIGSHVCERLLQRGHHVVALDSFDSAYDAAIKRRNVATLEGHERYCLVEADIRDLGGMEAGLTAAGVEEVDVVVHLAARVGVRPSIRQPVLYSETNVGGTAAVLELARRRGTSRLLFASSSSVYGDAEKVPFSEDDPAVRPLSPYAATKRAGELLCHAYHHLHGVSVVCLRFFTVYGPRQRPDMAIHTFARLMREGRPVPVYGNGSMERDYTYIDDILQGIEGAIEYTRTHPDTFEIVNLGESRTTSLNRLVEMIADALGVEPVVEHLPAPPGDVRCTYADIRKARRLLDYAPTIPVEVGIPRFVDWLGEVGTE